MKNIDLESIGFEDLLKLQKTVNKKVIGKRKNELGILFKEVKKLEAQKKVLNERIRKLQDIIPMKFFDEPFIKKLEALSFFTSDGDLRVYVYKNNKTEKWMEINLENMEIIRNDGFIEEELNTILKIIQSALNSDADNQNEKTNKTA